MVLLYALQRFSLADWGRHADFKEYKKSHKIMIDNVDLELQSSRKDRVTHYGLKGRATNVFRVKSKKIAEKHPDIAKAGMVAKVFWGEQQRDSEPDILKRVYEIAEEKRSVEDHVPHLLWYHEFMDPTSEVREALGVSERTRAVVCSTSSCSPSSSPLRNSKAQTSSTCGSNASYVRGLLSLHIYSLNLYGLQAIMTSGRRGSTTVTSALPT